MAAPAYLLHIVDYQDGSRTTYVCTDPEIWRWLDNREDRPPAAVVPLYRAANPDPPQVADESTARMFLAGIPPQETDQTEAELQAAGIPYFVGYDTQPGEKLTHEQILAELSVDRDSGSYHTDKALRLAEVLPSVESGMTALFRYLAEHQLEVADEFEMMDY